MLILIAGVTGLTACGGSPGTPVGSSTITITATSGSISQSTKVNVTVTK
jgi:spermidine/putrescine-binding protein